MDEITNTDDQKVTNEEALEQQPKDAPLNTEAEPVSATSTPSEPTPVFTGAKNNTDTPEASKPKTNLLFFILGIIAPFVVYGITNYLLLYFTNLYGDTGSYSSGFSLLSIFTYAPYLLFFLFLFLFSWGKKTQNVKLWSFGKGALIVYAVMLIGGLLLFGACFLTLGGYGK